MKRDAKNALKHALSEEELYVEEVRDHSSVGSHRGLDVAGLSARTRVLEQKMASHAAELASQHAEIASLQDEVLTLKLSSEEYRLVRNQFISTFKRDKLNNADGSDIKIIQGGNLTVQGGDAIVDAMLYQGLDRRRDSTAYKKLYGVDPLRVLRISKFIFNSLKSPG